MGVESACGVICFCLPGGAGAGTAGITVQGAAAGTEQQQPAAAAGANHRRKGGKGERSGVLVQCIRGKHVTVCCSLCCAVIPGVEMPGKFLNKHFHWSQNRLTI